MRDPTVWQQKLRDASPEEKPGLCEEALKIWPGSTEIWLLYLKNTDDVGKLLARALPLSVDTKLFEAYIEYIRSTQPEQLGDAFEYVLEKISFHPESGNLWKQYIDWKGKQPAANDWEESLRRDRVRQLYKKALILPLSNIESLWRSYGQFENQISRQSARTFIDNRSGPYMRARSAFITYENMTNGLSFSTMPSPETANANTSRWLQVVEWERNNPLELTSPEAVAERVQFAYRRATTCARWSPRLWFDAGTKHSHEFLVQGVEAMPESYLLAFKLSEYHESQGDFDGVQNVLRRLVAHLQSLGQNSTVGWVELVRSAHRMRGITAAREIVHDSISELSDPSAELYVTAAGLEKEAGNPEVEDQIWRFVYAKFANDSAFLRKYIDHLYANGDIANVRSVFEQAVTNSTISASGSVPGGATALETETEKEVGKDTAKDTLKNAMKDTAKDTAKGAGTPTADKKLWEHMLKLESQYAAQANTDLVALQQLEKRFIAQFPDTTNEIDLFVQRYGGNAVELFGLDYPETNKPPQPPLSQNDATPPPPPVALLPNGPLSKLLGMLPPASAYQGPEINTRLLMNIIQNR